MKLADDCHRCRLRETATQVVWGHGPLTARGVLVGEGPGKEEDKEGEPFIGKAGKELDAILIGQRSPRQNHYITNLVKCRPPGNRDPKADEIEACSYWLGQELSALTERVVIGSVGLPSTRHFLNAGATMEYNHGIMYGTEEWGPVLPIYHPAAGLRDQAVMMNVISDLTEFVLAVRGKKRLGHRKDEYPDPAYGGIDDILLELAFGPRVVSIDTEDGPDGSAWSVQTCFRPGSGDVWLKGDPNIEHLARYVREEGVLTVLHNALHDLPVLASLDIYPARIADTMVMAYLLQTEPQGLKPLAYRHCGMEMQDYGEVVGPYTEVKAKGYLNEILTMVWPDPEPVLEWKKGEPHVRQPQNITRRVRAALKKVDEKGASAWDTWHAMKDRGQVEKLMGPMRPAFLSDVPRADAIRYAARDPDATLRVYHALWPRIQALGLEETFWRDMRALPLVVDMMREGMPIDPPRFKELSDVFQEEMHRLEGYIRRVTGRDINPGSSPQIQELLFETLGVKPIKRGKTGPSADDSVLARLEPDVEVVKYIRDWRTYQKLKTSYADVVPGKAKDGRVHSTLRVTRTATGRLSSSDPNLQAQPVRTKEGRLIRDCYLAEEGYTFVSADYSQIEMRVTAHCSQDPTMCGIFDRDLDIHTRTAMEMFDLPEHDVDGRDHRYPAKRIGFGVLTDIQAPGLQREMLKEGAPPAIWAGKKGLARCGALIKRWHEIYAGVASWKESHKASSRRNLYVRDDLQGRIRFVPGVRSPSKWVRLDAEHAAVSGPIQMGAQAIIKEAMGQIREPCLDFGVRPLLQIHDDLVFEVPVEAVDDFVYTIRPMMENAIPLSIPVLVDVKVGRRWGSMEKWRE